MDDATGGVGVGRPTAGSHSAPHSSPQFQYNKKASPFPVPVKQNRSQGAAPIQQHQVPQQQQQQSQQISPQQLAGIAAGAARAEQKKFLVGLTCVVGVGFGIMWIWGKVAGSKKKKK